MRISDTRPISWIRSARKTFDGFPEGAQNAIMRALTIAAEGRRAEITKQLKGFGSGIFEVALRHRTDAYRAVYAVQLEEVGFCTPSRRRPSRVSRPRSRISI